MTRQEQLIAVFEDTRAYYTENPTLAEAVKESRDHTVFHPADDYSKLLEAKARAGLPSQIRRPFRRQSNRTGKTPASGSPC
jgi:hypothetical protein